MVYCDADMFESFFTARCSAQHGYAVGKSSILCRHIGFEFFENNYTKISLGSLPLNL